MNGMNECVNEWMNACICMYMKTFSHPHGFYNIVKATSMFESEAIDNIYANISVVRYFLVDISNQSTICKSLLP